MVFKALRTLQVHTAKGGGPYWKLPSSAHWGTWSARSREALTLCSSQGRSGWASTWYSAEGGSSERVAWPPGTRTDPVGTGSYFWRHHQP